jgi:glycosyltransferase involved in cell wall biosynthesis
VVVKNIVDLSDPIEPVNHFDGRDGEVYGLFVSRIERLKGLQDLLEAVPLIVEHVPTFKLIVAGDGPDLQNCIDMTKRLGISHRVTFFGHIDNFSVQSLYRKCDCFIFPTHYPEGMPMVLVEALKAGIPIITTKVLFALSYLTEFKHCLYVEKQDPNDLAEKVIRLVGNAELKRTMRREGSNFVRGFGKSVVGREFEAIYESMLSA